LLASERERLHELAIQALGHLLTHQQKVGDAEPAVQTGLHLLALDLLQEPVHRAVMRVSLHYLGDQTNARRHLERMLRRYVAPAHRSHAICFQYDQQVAISANPEVREDLERHLAALPTAP